MKHTNYKTAKHPKTGKLWIIGYCGTYNGRAQYIPIREVTGSAKTEIKHQLRADMAAKVELCGNSIRINQ